MADAVLTLLPTTERSRVMVRPTNAGLSGTRRAAPPGCLQPLLGIAIVALTLKIPGLMGGGAAGGNIVSSLLGTAPSAAVGTGLGGCAGPDGRGRASRAKGALVTAPTAAYASYRNGATWSTSVSRNPG
jgi:hypothetical protein